MCHRFHITSLYVFGSQAKEVASRFGGSVPAPGPIGSDLDVAVQPAAGALQDPFDRGALIVALEGLFGISPVDLVLLPEADAFLAADAVRGELLFCDDPDVQAREELYCLRRAGDLAPLQRDRVRGILSGEIRR